MVQLKRVFAAIALTLFATYAVSCSDDNPTSSATPSPKVSSVEPDSGEVGDTLTISGSNFSSEAQANNVLFNGVQAKVISASSSKIQTVVPVGASTGPLNVVVNGTPSKDVGFTVTSLNISRIEPDSAQVGTSVMLHGNHFSEIPDSNHVTFNGTAAEVTSASETQLETTVPAGATSGPVEIEVGEEVAVGPDFKVIYPDPTITAISPQTGNIGDIVTITGTNFMTIADSNHVTFNGAPAEVTSASETKLTTIVPEDASNGPVEVTVRGATATGPDFTLEASLTIDSFSAEKKSFQKVTAVEYSWEIINPQATTLSCELDTDGDGMTDYTIDSCSDSDNKVWVYRRKLSGYQANPELTVTTSNGSSSDSKSLPNPVQIDARRTTDLSTDAFHVLALDNKGAITAWGDDSDKMQVPSEVQGKTIAIATSKNNSFIITEDNTVVGLGANGNGQIDIPSDVQGHAVDVSSGLAFGVVLKDDGTVTAWGLNDTRQTEVPSGLSNVVAISSGEFHTLALKADGTVVAWGRNNQGQSDPPAKLQNVVGISTAHASSAALKFDGSVSGWGRPANGADTPPSDLSEVVDIAGGGFHHNALQADGAIRVWGRDKGAESLDRPGFQNVIIISTDFEYGIAIKEDGSVVGWGGGNSNQANSIPQGLDLIQ